jgi:hypothetical protein
MTHVLSKGVRVHTDLGMIVWAEKGGAFDTYRAIAERGALSAYRNDSYMLGLLHPFYVCLTIELLG